MKTQIIKVSENVEVEISKENNTITISTKGGEEGVAIMSWKDASALLRILENGDF